MEQGKKLAVQPLCGKASKAKVLKDEEFDEIDLDASCSSPYKSYELVTSPGFPSRRTLSGCHCGLSFPRIDCQFDRNQYSVR